MSQLKNFLTKLGRNCILANRYACLPAARPSCHLLGARQSLHNLAPFKHSSLLAQFHPRWGHLAAHRPCSSAASEATEKMQIITLRGLPYKCTEADIIDFLKGVNVVGGARGVKLIYKQNLLVSGLALVQVAKAEDVERALSLDHEMFGKSNRYIDVYSYHEGSKVFKDSFTGSTTGHSIQLTPPAGATREDIMKFFAPLEPVRIEIRSSVFDAIAKTYTMAYVDFNSHEDACLAMERNMQPLLGHTEQILRLVSYDGDCAQYYK